MKNQLYKFYLAATIAVAAFLMLQSPIVAAADKPPAPSVIGAKTARTEMQFGIGDVFKIFKPLLSLIGRKNGYQSLEKNIFAAMPEKMPSAYRSLNGVEVYADSAPTAEELAAIDDAFARLIRNTSGDFAEYNNFTPVEAFRNWKSFRKPSEFRVWLVENPLSLAASEADETLGCPLIRTSNSATGKAAEVFGGIKISGSKAKAVYPIIIAPRVAGTNLARPECRQIRNNGIYFGMEHAATLNAVKIRGKTYQSFVTFMGAGDWHNIFKDR